MQLRDADALRALEEVRNERLAEPESDGGVHGGLWRLTAGGIDATHHANVATQPGTAVDSTKGRKAAQDVTPGRLRIVADKGQASLTQREVGSSSPPAPTMLEVLPRVFDRLRALGCEPKLS